MSPKSVTSETSTGASAAKLQVPNAKLQMTPAPKVPKAANVLRDGGNLELGAFLNIEGILTRRRNFRNVWKKHGPRSEVRDQRSEIRRDGPGARPQTSDL